MDAHQISESISVSRKELEEYCKSECDECDSGVPIIAKCGHWYHDQEYGFFCSAWRLRDTFAKMHPELFDQDHVTAILKKYSNWKNGIYDEDD